MKKTILTLFICLLLIFPGFALAENEEDLVVLLIIDQSGSMLDTDPQNYRLASAGLLVDILGGEDRLGILSFSSDVKILHETKSLGDDRTSFQDALAKMESPQGATDYLLALQKARELLLQSESTRCSIVFLTDGDPEPDEHLNQEFMTKYHKQLDELVEQFALENCSIYTVGFGSSSGEILEPMSSKTHGLSFIDSKPKELAGNFFSILSSLKNRETMVEEKLKSESKSYSFKFDSNTTQVNCLVLGEFSGKTPVFKNGAGQVFRGKVAEGYSSIVLTKEHFARADNWTLEVPTGATDILVARDTLIQLDILAPVIQAEFSEESPIDLAVEIRGVDKEVVLEARPVRRGEILADWISLQKQEGLYRARMDGVFSSGQLEVEFRVRDEEDILTSISVPVHIKRIPELQVEIRSSQEALVGNSDVTLSAWLTRNGQILRGDSVNMEEFRLVRNSSIQEVDLIDLRDDGEEGDLIKGDGIYSVRFTLEESGDLKGEVQAQGLYGQESFQLSKILQSIAIEKPGSLEIVLNGNQPLLEGAYKEVVEIPLKISNLADYSETLTISVKDKGIELVNPIFNLKAKEGISTVLQMKVNDQTKDRLKLDFAYEARNPSTEMSSKNSTLELLRKADGELRQEKVDQFMSRYGVYLLPVLLLVIGVLIGFVLKRKKREQEGKRLTGHFSYEKDGEQKTFPLSGEMIRIAIGQVNENTDHMLEGRERGFVLTLRRKPGVVNRDEKRFHLQCTLPGVISFKGLEASSFEIGYDEEFSCGGYLCMIRKTE